MKQIAFALFALTFFAAGRAAAEDVAVEHPNGSVCYRYLAESVCVHDADYLPGLTFTLDNKIKPPVWQWRSKDNLSGLALRRNSLGRYRFDIVDGFLSVMAILKTPNPPAVRPVVIEPAAGKSCYRYAALTICVRDGAPGVSYCLDRDAKPAKWETKSKNVLPLPLTTETLGTYRFDDAADFQKAIDVISRAAPGGGEALERLQNGDKPLKD